MAIVEEQEEFIARQLCSNDLPPFSVPIIKRVPGQFLAFVVLSGAALPPQPPRREQQKQETALELAL